MGSLGGSYQKTSSGTEESAISQQQLEILKNREQQYNNWFFPNMSGLMNELTPGTDAFNANLGLQTDKINQAYGSAAKQTNQQLAQQGLLGEGNGVQASTDAYNRRARASALANAYQNTLVNNQQQKANLLGVAANLMPRPTSDVAYLQSSSGSMIQGNGSINGLVS